MTTKDNGLNGRIEITRRELLKGTAGAEVKAAKLGYIALINASPLVIANEKNLFAKHGLY